VQWKQRDGAWELAMVEWLARQHPWWFMVERAAWLSAGGKAKS